MNIKLWPNSVCKSLINGHRFDNNFYDGAGRLDNMIVTLKNLIIFQKNKIMTGNDISSTSQNFK